MEEIQNDSFISVSLNSKGRYFWTIKLGFKDRANVVNEIKELNKQMKETFVRNTEDLGMGNRVSTKSFGLDEDSED